MKSVLFPTDFSEQSLRSFLFVLEYAKKMNYKIIVFHAYDNNSKHSYLLESVYKDIDVNNYKEKKIPFPPIAKLITESYENISIKYVVKKGTFINAITEYVTSKEDKIDTVIMAANNKDRFVELFVETETLKIMEVINKPVIAIPEDFRFDSELNEMVFLVDYRDCEKTPLMELIEKAKEFNAKLHVLHFDLAHGESISPLMKNFKETLSDQNFENVDFISIDAIDIKSSLKEYCRKNHIDLVCLMNQRKNFYQRLFTHSLAEDLIKNLKTPVMAIYCD